MTKEQLKKTIPEKPGVYFFLGTRKEILYIGKATSLRSRVRSYFSDDLKEKRSELISNMVAEAKTVEWTVTDSVLEALILETNLIRIHKPRCNTISKDDKSFNHVVITNEEFPRVLVMRAKDLRSHFEDNEIAYEFGPFPSSALFKEALRIIRRIFQFYDTKKPIEEAKSKLERGRIDFNRQIGLYPEQTSKKEYRRTIRHIRLFFEGKKKQLITELEHDMKEYAKEKKFELAHEIKKKIFALKHIQDVSLIKRERKQYHDERSARIEGYDVAHLGGEDMVGVMTVLTGGEVDQSEYRAFNIKSVHAANDTAALTEMLERRLGHTEWLFPQLIVVDGSTAQKNAAERVLKKYGIVIPVVAVVKDEHHRPKNILGPKKLISDFDSDILLVNAEAHRFSLKHFRNKQKRRQLHRG